MRLVRVRRHVRLIDGSLRVIPAHWRRIADAEPDAGAVVRDDRTGELFGGSGNDLCAGGNAGRRGYQGQPAEGCEEGVEMSKVNDGGPAFPCETVGADEHGEYRLPWQGMTLRQYAAIKLRVPNSGTDWLDEMIRESLRDEMAGKAMPASYADYCEHADVQGYVEGWRVGVAKDAYESADAMLAARGGK